MKSVAKRTMNEFTEFVKNNKITCGLSFLAGMAIAAKSYPLAIALNIAAAANYFMDRVVDQAIAEQTVQCWLLLTPEARRSLIKAANLMPDASPEEVEAMINEAIRSKS